MDVRVKKILFVNFSLSTSLNDLTLSNRQSIEFSQYTLCLILLFCSHTVYWYIHATYKMYSQNRARLMSVPWLSVVEIFCIMIRLHLGGHYYKQKMPLSLIIAPAYGFSIQLYSTFPTSSAETQIEIHFNHVEV